MKALLNTTLCFVWVLLLALDLGATTIRRLTNQEMTQKAELITIGRCTETKSAWVGRNLVTLATISVSEVLKGGRQATITVVLPGGVDANRKIPIAMTVAGAPRIVSQEEVFLFLVPDGEMPSGHAIVGFSQGKFSIAEDAKGEKMISRNLTGVRLQAEGGIVQGTSNLVPLEQF